MTWTKPDFVEISLCMEVTAYVNTDASVVSGPSSALGTIGSAGSGLPAVTVAPTPPSGNR
ncbi:MAG TPA: pyrroloquinoline quinone precursor peptide PqqA [Pirellulales bacterium]|nr:pyrroloquinoline quinone precursor peptide PqqA [Pirellulales bacterium]